MWDKLALILLIIGGVNWGLVGIFEFDLVAWLFGGAASLISRAIYILVAISAVWCITLLFRNDQKLVEVEAQAAKARGRHCRAWMPFRQLPAFCVPAFGECLGRQPQSPTFLLPHPPWGTVILCTFSRCSAERR